MMTQKLYTSSIGSIFLVELNLADSDELFINAFRALHKGDLNKILENINLATDELDEAQDNVEKVKQKYVVSD